jgi:hypothetical protein
MTKKKKKASYKEMLKITIRTRDIVKRQYFLDITLCNITIDSSKRKQIYLYGTIFSLIS